MKDKPIFVKTSAAEHKRFSKLAEVRNMNLSQLIRYLLHREADTAKISKT